MTLEGRLEVMEQSTQIIRRRGEPSDSTLVWLDESAPTQLVGGRLSALITAAGAGGLSCDGVAVTRWDGDLLRQAYGTFVYLRDLDSGVVWSAGLQPVPSRLEHYACESSGEGVRIERVEHGIAATLEITLTPDGVELRRCTVTNLGSEPRRLEIVSYLEWVLQDAAADASHPAFSKLFVETSVDRQSRQIIARRRRRSPDQQILAGGHALVELVGKVVGELSFETSRSAFIGRGGSLRVPAALGDRATKSGLTGPVLDPIASWRTGFFIAGGESASILFATTAAAEPDAVANTLLKLRGGSDVARQGFAAANRAPSNGQARHADAVDHQVRRPIDNAGRTKRRYDSPHELGGGQRFARLIAPADSRHAIPADVQVPLVFDNGWGGFTEDGREYVVRLRPRDDGSLKLPPLPWVNIVANEEAGFIATETGAGYAFTANSRENRLTPWHNDPVVDPVSEAIYLRDRESWRYWSPLPAPAGPGAACDVTHGFGYTQYRQQCAGLRQRTTMFVPPSGPVKLTQIELENLDSQGRELDLVYAAELSLGNGARDMTAGATAWYDEEVQAVFAENPRREQKNRVAFAALVAADSLVEASACCDLAEFLGPLGDFSAPQAVVSGRQLAGAKTGSGPACAALQTFVTIPANGTAEIVVLLGEAESEAEARRMIAEYRRPGAADAALAAAQDKWRTILSAVEVETPSQAINFLVNGWLPYQNLSCRIWARSAYYQAGGAYGFRDQLQDSAAYVFHRPDVTRQQILRNAAHQFVEGDVLHWWHPPRSAGLRTRFADDLLWLPMIAAEYCATTGDESLWDESTPYVTGPELDADEDERFIVPSQAGFTGTVYEHCCKAIDRSLGVGAHGLPLMGCGDWNDGMNRIGHGRGESVWMGFFLCYVLERMAPVCRRRGDAERAERYEAHRAQLATALNAAGWDGQWYRRAFFDDGTPVGSIESEECQIDALAQAWAVMSGVAPADRAAAAVAAVEERLVCPEAGILKLLDPPFDRSQHDPGYIQGYVPGVRENGGQYTHGVLWFIRALAELGRGSRAVELLEMLTPIRHGDTPDKVARYQAEPYVVAADVYGQPPHEGRAGWTWYTGSAGWMFRVAVESILGLKVVGGETLVISPAISADWPSCRFTYRPDRLGTEYEIVIENPHGKERGVTSASVDQRIAEVVAGAAHVPFARDRRRHCVRIVL